MPTIRIFFTKKREAAYISHLDLQRVMARALRRSGLPVWYTQGFNPHIYMTFALPLPLMQESEVETVDCKTESELTDFSGFLPALNKALPRGIVAGHIAFPVYQAAEIVAARYLICYDIAREAQVKNAIEEYNRAAEVNVVRKTKRSETEINLKDSLPRLIPVEQDAKTAFEAVLPAGPTTFNPDMLLAHLEKNNGLPRSAASVLRTKVLVANGAEFQ